MSNALASIALTFPDCVNRGDDPCDAWRHMAEQWKLATAQYDELQKREQALRARLDICHDEDGGVHDEIDRLKAALLNAEFDNEQLEEERAKFAGLYAAESHKGMVLLEELSRQRWLAAEWQRRHEGLEIAFASLSSGYEKLRAASGAKPE